MMSQIPTRPEPRGMAESHYALACQIERAAWTNLYRTAPREVHKNLGLGVADIDGARVLSARELAHPLLNRAWAPSAEPARLVPIERHYRQLGIDRFLIHVEQRAGSAPEANQGLVRHRRNWVKLLGRLDLDTQPRATSSLTVRTANARDATACGDLFCTGFTIPARAAPLFSAAVGRAGWRVLVACDENQAVVATGYLFIEGSIAYLCGAATAPSHRRRGAQSALLAARLSAARAAGCRWIASETGEAVPGDPQHSQHNMERHGLHVVGVTENFVPAGFSWQHGVTRKSNEA